MSLHTPPKDAYHAGVTGDEEKVLEAQSYLAKFRPSYFFGAVTERQQLDERLRVLSYGLLSYDHEVLPEDEVALTAVMNYLRNKLHPDAAHGRVTLHEYSVTTNEIYDEVGLRIDGPFGRAAYYGVSYANGHARGTMSTWMSPDQELPHQDNFSNRPYAVGRILVASLDVVRFWEETSQGISVTS